MAIDQETALQLTRRYAVPKEKVFAAWTNPEVMRRWWRGGGAMENAGVDIDLREGGRYRLSMRDPNSGEVHTVVGEYREVRSPDRLAFTWSWEGADGTPMAGEETLVEVDFRDDGDGTEVMVTHSGFGGAESRGMHEHGWTAVIANLEPVLVEHS